MAVFGRYGFFQIVVSFFPLSFGGFVQADEGVDETVGDEMELFGLQVVFHGTFLISQLEEGMSFHQVGIGKLVIGHRGIVACFDCFVEHLLVKVATGQSKPVRSRIRILVNQLIEEEGGFFKQSLGIVTIAGDGKVGFFFGIFFESARQPCQCFFRESHVNVHIGYIDDIGQVVLIVYAVEYRFRFFFFAFAQQ